MIASKGADAIHADNTSAAQSITDHAASIVEEHLRAAGSACVDLKQELLDLGLALINAQPAMASLYNLFNSLLREFDACRDRGKITTILRDQARQFSRAMKEHNRAIAQQASRAIPELGTVFTHSDSSALRAALQRGYSDGKRFAVCCGESRPACEGSRLARALAVDGIPTCLTTDSLIFSLLRDNRANAVVLVGADSITVHGVVNKAGTVGLAAACGSWGVPLYVLAGSEKFLPASLMPRTDQDRPPEEILSQPSAGLRIINRYFDVTPLDSISAVVCEEGFLSARDLAAKLEPLAIHPGLVAALARETEP